MNEIQIAIEATKLAIIALVEAGHWDTTEELIQQIEMMSESEIQSYMSSEQALDE